LAGTQHARPVKKPKAKIPHYNVAAGIIWNQHHEVLIQQRAEGGLLAGLWEFPGGKQEAGETLEQTIAREIAEELSIVVSVKGALPPIHHAYTHFKITLYPFHCQFISGVPTLNVAQNMQWCLPKELGKLPFPKANIPIIQSLSGFDVTTLSMVFPF
jgi:A/G-specific adenine glycosylase